MVKTNFPLMRCVIQYLEDVTNQRLSHKRKSVNIDQEKEQVTTTNIQAQHRSVEAYSNTVQSHTSEILQIITG